MSNSRRKLSLKPYLDAVREHCQGLSRQELEETLMELAQEVPVRGRADFLDKIRGRAPKAIAKAEKTDGAFEEALLERISVLEEEIGERIRAIENGDYHEDSGYWENGGYDEEEPDYVTSEQSEELEDLFLETGGIFLDGRLETARRLYRALFDLFDKHGEISGYLSQESMDIREERARYCRCIYETVDPGKRVQSLLDCMDIDAPMDGRRLDLLTERFPMLRDVIEAGPGELPDLGKFLNAWEKMLARKPGDRAAVLRLEAVQKLRGIDGVSKLVHQWKDGQPRGYLYWIQCLERERDWRGMLDACREALEALPKGTFREQAAEHLTQAASKLGEREYVLLGKRERFRSLPGERNLLELLREAASRNVRSRELDTALAALERDKGGKSEHGDLYLKMLLMGGKLDRAFDVGRREKSIGWSYGKAGVLFASLLSVLTENSAKATIVNALLKEYAGRGEYFCDDGDGDNDAGAGVNGTRGAYEEILVGLKSVGISESEARKYAAWADKTGRDRIEAIVSGQHRGAYDRAARVLGALAEYYILTGEKEKARSLLHEFIFTKFPRHNAFRREVKNMASGSPLVKDLRVI